MKKVLIALDYDHTAQKVAEQGFEFAKSMGAEVVLLHVITDPVYYSSLEYSPIVGFSAFINTDPLQTNTTEVLKIASYHFLDNTRKHLGDESIQTRVADGDYARAILDTAKSIHAHSIVLGSHSKKWLENVVMGSVTQEVLQHTTLPLYIIPTKKRG